MKRPKLSECFVTQHGLLFISSDYLVKTVISLGFEIVGVMSNDDKQLAFKVSDFFYYDRSK